MKTRISPSFLATYGGQTPFHPPPMLHFCKQTSYFMVYNMIYLIWIIFISAELTIEIWECISRFNTPIYIIHWCALCNMQCAFWHRKIFKYFKYRVSHETWQLVISFECFLPYTVLDIKDFLQFILFKKCFTQMYFTFKSILL